MKARRWLALGLGLALVGIPALDVAAQGGRGMKGGGRGPGGMGSQMGRQQYQYRYGQGKMGQGMRGKMGPGMQGMHGMKGMKGRMGGGPGMMGMAGDARFQADRQMFHFLLNNRKKIQRNVKMLDNGIETVTESDDPKVAAVIQKHVASMYERLEKGQPVRMGDPLFRALFQNAGKVKMTVEKTEKGVHVTETSDDPYVAKLIQAHAKVVSLFVKRGFDEARKPHPLPKNAPAKKAAAQ